MDQSDRNKTTKKEKRKKKEWKSGVVGRIYEMKYGWKGHKDRNRHKNRIKRNGQTRLVYVKDITRNVPTTWRWASGDTWSALIRTTSYRTTTRRPFSHFIQSQRIPPWVLSPALCSYGPTSFWITKTKVLDRQGTQQQRPESPTVTPPGVWVNTRYINSTKGTS